MKAQNFPEANRKLVGEGCHDLPAIMYEKDGYIMWDTYWSPTEEELVYLNAGMKVRLTVLGDRHPPVKIGVGQ
jgi:hypothetical protein